MQTPCLPFSLTDEECRRFQDEGYLLVPEAPDRATTARLSAAVDRVESHLQDTLACPDDGSASPHEDDSLMDKLLASDPKFQALVAKSKASPRKPFAAGDRGHA